MSRVRVAAVTGAFLIALLLAGCAGRPPARSAPASSQSPAAGRQRGSRAARLAWRVGEAFTGAVTFDQRDQGAVDDELRFTAHERFQVVQRRAGVATLRGVVTSWRWRRNTSELLTTSPPGPFTFGVDARGEIVSGVDWPLPADLPLPGLDVFAAPLGSGAGWSRTDAEGAGLSYQAKAGSPSGATALDWSVVRPRFTLSGAPITVSGRAQAVVSSRYRRRRAVATVRFTRERAAFERTTRSAGGVTRETGTILETTVFSPP